jgi:serine/threonine protein kinase
MLVAGSTFGPYHLQARLSSGGMGEVWRALKTGAAKWTKEVALKVIRSEVAANPKFVSLFENEARVSAQLDHPNIVTTFGFGDLDGVYYLEQELIRGQDLAQILARLPQPMAPSFALHITAEILKGLAAAHEYRGDGASGILHRDIKPGNVLVSNEGMVKLADFGVARLIATHELAAGIQTQLKGTPAYMAPELLAEMPPSPQSDLYAVGLILWELLTARPLHGSVADLRSAGVQVSDQVEQVVHRLLHPHPAGRYASARQALATILAMPEGRAVTSVDLRSYLAPSAPTVVVAPDVRARAHALVAQADPMPRGLAPAPSGAPKPRARRRTRMELGLVIAALVCILASTIAVAIRLAQPGATPAPATVQPGSASAPGSSSP